MSQANPNLHVRDYLNYYTGLDRPLFAVLITGSWGVGKTWLVRNYFKDRADTKHVYVSLYGAQNADEIAQRLFVGMHPILASKGVAIAGRVIKGLLKASFAVNLDGGAGEDARVTPDVPGVDDASEIARNRLRFRDTTLILDDVERCSALPAELWGFVNRLMEQDGARVVLLANEEKLSDKDHRETKEKNVGMTLRIVPDISNILQAFIRAESETLLPLQQRIEEVLEVSTCENLRVIRFAVRDLGRVFSALSSDVLKLAEAAQSVTSTAVALSVEVYSGNISPQMLPGLSMARYLSRRASEATEDEDEIRLRAAFAKYAGVLEVGYVPPSLGWWQAFFERGVLDADALNAALLAHFDKTDRRPPWHRITALSTLENQEFESLLHETWSSLVDKSYRIPGEILHVAGVQLWASRNGLSQRPLQEIVIETKNALGNLEDDELFAAYRLDWADEHFEAYASMKFTDGESVEFREVVAHGKTLQGEAIKARARLKARDLLAALEAGSRAFDVALDDRREGLSELDKAVLRTPLLCEIERSEFVTRLLDLPAKDLNAVVSTLYRRLRALGPRDELDWVREVSEIAKSGPGLRRFIAGRRLEQLFNR